MRKRVKPVTYRFNEWMHVKIVFAGNRGEVYIDDMEAPAVVLHELLREPRAGKVGLMAGNFAPAWFSGFGYRETAPPFAGRFPDLPPAADGTVMAYLGTIGLFDEVMLPLQEGNNELWMAVSDIFGGWGIAARFPDLDGIQVTAGDQK